MVSAVEDRLARSYRHWLRIYPRWYRRERGLELLTTLLDDATPGQRRPRTVDIVSLLRAGIRTRLRPPRQPLAYLIIGVVAPSLALAAASAAVVMGPYPGPPPEDEAIAVASIAVGPPTWDMPSTVEHCPCGGASGAYDQVVATDEEPMRIDNTIVYYNPPWEYALTTVEQAHQRLTAAGWHAEPIRDANWYPSFTASSHHYHVDVTADPNLADVGGAAPTVAIYVSKQVNADTVTGVAAAGLGGLIAGWMLVVWALHRFRRHRLWRRRVILLATTAYIGAATLIMLLTFLLAMSDFQDGVDDADIQAPVAFTAISPATTHLTTVPVLTGLIALVLVALPGPPREADTPAGRPGDLTLG